MAIKNRSEQNYLLECASSGGVSLSAMILASSGAFWWAGAALAGFAFLIACVALYRVAESPWAGSTVVLAFAAMLMSSAAGLLSYHAYDAERSRGALADAVLRGVSVERDRGSDR